MWEMVSMLAGLMVVMVLLNLMDLPERVGVLIKSRLPRQDLESKLQDLESRIAKLEKQTTASQSQASNS